MNGVIKAHNDADLQMNSAGSRVLTGCGCDNDGLSIIILGSKLSIFGSLSISLR